MILNKLGGEINKSVNIKKNINKRPKGQEEVKRCCKRFLDRLLQLLNKNN